MTKQKLREVLQLISGCDELDKAIQIREACITQIEKLSVDDDDDDEEDDDEDDQILG